MIFKREINPRDYDGYYGMIAHLQTECIRQFGAGFDTTKIAMGQVAPNAEMCWFEGHVDDADIRKVVDVTPHHKTAEEYLFGKTYAGSKVLPTADAIECIRLDRLGGFADSPALHPKTVNVHIASLGNFTIKRTDDEDLYQLRKHIVDVLTRAVNDIKC